MKLLIYIAILLSILSCSHSQYDLTMDVALKKKLEKNQETIFDGEPEPAFPNLEINNKGMLGIDSNNNGIRDDIEIWINRTAKDANERKALKQYAKSFYAVLIDIQKNGSGYKNNKEYLLSKKYYDLRCIDFIFPSPTKNYLSNHIYEKIRTLTFNTELRKDEFWKYYNNSSFAISTFTNGKHENYEFCDFQIENLEQLKRNYTKLRIK